MLTYRKRAAGAALAGVLLLAGATACEGGDKGGTGKAAAPSPSADRSPVRRTADEAAVDALVSAYEKTSAAKSAKVRMAVRVPKATGAPGDPIETTGVQGWDPNVVDLTVKGASAPGLGSGTMRVIGLNGISYVQLPADSPLASGGKRWVKLDLKEPGGTTGALSRLGGLGDAPQQGQDPATLLALMVSSPNLKHVGAETVEGADTEHYAGTLSVDELRSDANPVLTPSDHGKLVTAMGAAGIQGYSLEVWVDRTGLPVRTKTTAQTPGGTDLAHLQFQVDASYAEYGAAATAQAPPEDETLDLFGMLTKPGEGA
ncbi:hypothetical protein ACFXPI_24195 [Streptomyces sp. NPDC059104]|uniref:hypothetical protein n=1 Tax=Streptomyces sp. NPDC059104 TaxID=3346729 RepID=UPI00368D4C21